MVLHMEMDIADTVVCNASLVYVIHVMLLPDQCAALAMHLTIIRTVLGN